MIHLEQEQTKTNMIAMGFKGSPWCLSGKRITSLEPKAYLNCPPKKAMMLSYAPSYYGSKIDLDQYQNNLLLSK